MEVLKLTRFSCAQPVSFFESMVITLVGFKVVFVLVVGALIVEKACRKRRQVRKLLRAGGPSVADWAGTSTPAELAGESDDDASAPQGMQYEGWLCCVGGRASHDATASDGLPVDTWGYVLRHINWPHVVRVAFQLAVFLYPAASLAIARTFRCTAVDGQWYLVADLRQKCFTAEWAGYAVYAGACGILYSLGLPAYITYYLWRRRDMLDTPDMQVSAGFL